MHGPLQAPREYVDKYQGIRNMRRRRYAAMVDIVDEAIGNVTQTMKEAGYVAIVLSWDLLPPSPPGTVAFRRQEREYGKRGA